jgi:uncharacterized phosphosugar-binding protein
MLLDKYWDRVDNLYKQVRDTQRDNIIAAGQLIAEAVDNGGCVHICDSGHIIDSELIYRGGGLILYKRFKYNLNVENPVRKRDRSDLNTSMEGLAKYALRASGARPGDVLILGSVSGRTFYIADLAQEAKAFGMKIIALTSMSYATTVDSVLSSGKKLYELADVVLDNCAPAAEAMMDVEGLDAHFGAASGLAGAYILWSVSAVVIDELLKRGKMPGILRSANYPGGNDYNKTFVEPRYEREGL